MECSVSPISTLKECKTNKVIAIKNEDISQKEIHKKKGMRRVFNKKVCVKVKDVKLPDCEQCKYIYIYIYMMSTILLFF